jgi:hypothetical protein
LIWRSVLLVLSFFLSFLLTYFIFCFLLCRRTARFWMKGKLVPYCAGNIPQSVYIGVWRSSFFLIG